MTGPHESPKDLELSIERHIDAPPAAVWKLMTERQNEWWCPKPWRAEVVEQDWRAGGRSSMMFYGPDGEEMPQEGIFLEVTPGVRFVSTDAITYDMRPAGPFMIGTWEIKPEGAGTYYRASARHWSEETMNNHKEMGFEDGWAACADQLAEIAEAEAKAEA